MSARIVQGNLANVKAYILEGLESLYDLSVPIGQTATNELCSKMLDLTDLLDREVAVYISRQGKIVQVSVGDNSTVDLPEFKAKSSLRLSGVRCIHTHPSGDSRLSSLDISSLKHMRFDLMVAVAREGKDINGAVGFFTGSLDEEGNPLIQIYGPVRLSLLNKLNITRLITMINKQLGKNKLKDTDEGIEKAIIAGIEYGGGKSSEWSLEESLAELGRLAETAGALVVASYSQKKDKPDAAFFFGKGKVDEIGMAVQDLEADMLIVDEEITPSQQHNLERMLGLKVLDRTALILDIFAQRARSQAGKLQVSLAQFKYQLPRLGGQGLVLSRLGGGIGTRGPGETKLEVDRRRIYGRIHDIEEELKKLSSHRRLHRSRRKEANIPLVALVGYTNAGKSTLLNALTGSDVFAEDKLFATLDPTTRHKILPDGQEILLTDTVGFIQKLPHSLVSAFHATLEEVTEADLLLHVVDCANESAELQIGSVTEVLRELGAVEKPTLFVFNKCDNLDNEHLRSKLSRDREGVFVSARDGENLESLLERISEAVRQDKLFMRLRIPFSDGAAVALLHEVAVIQKTEYNELGTLMEVLLPAREIERFKGYEVRGDR